MKFDAEDPAEVSKNDKQGEVDRSQGAARAISVSSIHCVEKHNLMFGFDSPSLILDYNGAT